LHAMMFNLGVIEPTWVNCFDFMEGEGFDADSLVRYLERDAIRKVVLEHPIPSDSNLLKLRLFLFKADSLSDVAYREYVHALPSQLQKPPEGLEPTKLRILIDERKIIFTKDSLDALADNRDLQVRFVAVNIGTYLADSDDFELDDDFREELLQSDVDNVAKLGIIKLMDLGVLVELPERSALIGPIIIETDANISKLDGSNAQSLVIQSKPIETQIALFNKFHSLMTDDEVRHVLTNLPTPFSEIETGYNTPRLKNVLNNQNLVRWLDSRNIISSWSEGSLFKNTIRVNLYRGL